MTQFDKSAFEALMARSVQLQREDRYEEALALNTEAHDIAPEGSFEKGRAARDSAARLDRLGRVEEATAFAVESYTIHSDLLVGMGENPSREAYRERSVSAMFVGVIGLRSAIRAERAGEDVSDTTFVDYLRSTLDDLEMAKDRADGINQYVDQYQINATRRVSVAESLFGRRSRGVVLGARAVALAFMSESPKMDTANPTLTFKERLSIKKKALLGGVAALGVAIFASSESSRRRDLALTIVDKVI